MLLTIKLFFIRLLYLFRSWGKPYVVYATPKDFRRLLMLKHNQRRERGNVLRFLGKRRGSFNATASIVLALWLGACSPPTEPTAPRIIAIDCVDAAGQFYPCPN